MPIIVRVNSQQSACHDVGEMFVNAMRRTISDMKEEEGGVATNVKMSHVEVGLASVDAVLSQSSAEIFRSKSSPRFIFRGLSTWTPTSSTHRSIRTYPCMLVRVCGDVRDELLSGESKKTL